LVRHCAHAFVVVLQTLVAPVHFEELAAVHCTQAPLAAHAVRWLSPRVAQSASPPHGWHFSVDPQMGVVPKQLVEDVHWTQVLVAPSQTGFAPVQLAVLAAVHSTHAPVAAHAARAGEPSATHSASVAHALHLSVVAQMGVTPEHVAADKHWTQVLLAGSQIAVPPVHAAFDVDVHCTHRPLGAQTGTAGFFARHCASVWQPVHTLPAQNGLAGSVQSLAAVQVPAASGTVVCSGPPASRGARRSTPPASLAGASGSPNPISVPAMSALASLPDGGGVSCEPPSPTGTQRLVVRSHRYPERQSVVSPLQMLQSRAS
jgi:hypothetical protein